MDRTFKINDLFYYFDSLTNRIPIKKEFGQKPVKLPLKSDKPFAILKKLIIPKQVDDRVWINFSGDYTDIYVFIDGISIFADENGLYEITQYIKRGKPSVTAVVKSGIIDGLYVTVKRDKHENK